jgi:hypothetical protein
MSEEWKPLEFPRYEVSNLGRVRRVDTGAIISQRHNKQNYTETNLQFRTHRLVAQAFLGPPPTLQHTVDHINRKRDDNRVENLRWATSLEQTTNRILRLPASGYHHIYFKKHRNKYYLQYKAPGWATERCKSFATLEEALVVRQQWYDEE